MALEIERKFLVLSENVPADGAWPQPYIDSHIVQSYLIPSKKRITSERVRMRIPASGGTCSYTHTQKIRVSDGVHEEDEKEITKQAYDLLLTRRDPAMCAISKRRRVFEWAGKTFELDTFGIPHKGLVILEIEIPSMETVVEMPPFLRIEREVTTEKGFTNAAMARKGCWP